MYRYRSYMGPRGRRTGHRGSLPAVVAGVIGLMFGGWIIIAVLGGLLGAGVMVLGSLFAALGRIISFVFSRLFTTESFAIGLGIGLVWSVMKKRQAAEAAREEAAREETTWKETTSKEEPAEAAPADEAEPEIIETRHYTFHA